MIISCEKCAKKFIVADNLIPLDGRSLKYIAHVAISGFLKKIKTEKTKSLLKSK